MKNVKIILVVAALIALASLQSISGQQDVNAGDIGMEVLEGESMWAALDWKESVIPDYIVQVEQVGAEVLGVKCRIGTYATKSQIETIKGYEWAWVTSPYRWELSPPDEKVFINVRSNLSITSTQVDQVRQTGAELSGDIMCWIYANATKSQRKTIEGYDWVISVGPQPGGEAGGTAGGARAPARKPKAFLLANSIDYDMSSGFTAFLDNKGIEVVHVDASEFEQHTLEKFIVILGGPDAPEGVGEIVQQVLESDEQDYLRAKGNRRIYVKANPWRPHGGVVMVIAGSDRYETQKAHEENREQAHLKIMR